MRRLASVTLLSTLALLTSAAQAQMRGGGGGGMHGGGGMRGGGVQMSAPRVSSGRPISSGPIGQGFRGAPAVRPSFSRGPSFRGQSAPIGSFNRQNFNTAHFSPNSRVFVNVHGRHFHNAFFRNPFFFNNGFFGANCFGTFAFGNPFCGGFVGSAFLFGDPFFGLGYGYGYPSAYGYYPGYSSPSPDYYPQQSSSGSDTNEVALTAEIQRLNDQIDYLRDDLNNNSNRDQQNQDRSSTSSGANTIFVLRDGRRFTAQNYAISGQTLWILNEHSARKTPLSDIDREATEKANAANGVEIHLPEPTPPN